MLYTIFIWTITTASYVLFVWLVIDYKFGQGWDFGPFCCHQRLMGVSTTKLVGCKYVILTTERRMLRWWRLESDTEDLYTFHSSSYHQGTTANSIWYRQLYRLVSYRSKNPNSFDILLMVYQGRPVMLVIKVKIVMVLVVNATFSATCGMQYCLTVCTFIFSSQRIHRHECQCWTV